MSDIHATPLPARDGYRLWAPTYDVETPVTVLDDAAVQQLTPPLAGTALLDAGCGTGRRLRHGTPPARGVGPRKAVGIDLVPEMLTQGKHRAPELRLAAADLTALPFADRLFDVVWCRLAVGHIAGLDRAYAELARVTCRGGRLIVTDFHPAAARVGLVRSFRDALGTVHVIEHHVHELRDHQDAAARVGLTLDAQLEPAVGPAVRAFYENARRLDRYAQQRGLPIVLALRFTG